MAKPISVLIVEDSEEDAALILLTLRRAGYDADAERVDTAQGMVEALSRRTFDLVLSDYSMPTLSGLDALAIALERGRGIPFIAVSGAIGEETAIELMRRGAGDCIMKDNLSRLPPAVERELGEAQVRREREEALESLRRELALNAALAELSKNLIAIPEDISAVSALVLKYAKELTGSRHGFVGTVDPHGRTMTALTFTEMRERECSVKGGGSIEFPAGADGLYGGLWGHALNTRRPFIENDPGGHPASKGLPEGHIPVEKFLAAPVMSGEVLVGQIAIANPGRDYGAHDLTAIGRLADLFSIAVANYRTLLEKEELSRRLRQVQKIEAIGTLAGGIAHDFNNILTPMTGYAELVQMCLPRDSKVWTQQDHVLKACSRAKELVEQILALSRRTEEERRPTNPAPVVKEALRLLRSSFPATIEIRTNIDTRCGLVLAVPSQVHQVVMNLCTNAYHAMREKGGTLSVSLARWPGGVEAAAGGGAGDSVRLEVSDTGSGMSREIIEKIFDPYFTTKKKGEGTGLGLSIVDSIVRKHGGRISVTSEPGTGTTFRIDLPAVAGDPSVAKAPAAGDATFSGTERLMVVDDVVEIVEMAKEMLEGLGYAVTAFTSPTEALAAFVGDPRRYDLVITDLTMPNLNGIELARQILAIRPELPVVLCSGMSEGTPGQEALPAGIRSFLKKPILLHEYGQAIRRLLDEAGRG